MIEELPLASWTGPHDATLKARAVTALESGAVLHFPHLPFLLKDDEKEFLSASVADGKAKNISLDHTTGKMQASSLTGDKAARLTAMLERFGAGATQLVQELLPYRAVERAAARSAHENFAGFIRGRAAASRVRKGLRRPIKKARRPARRTTKKRG